jgi:hypothetical protein
MEDSPLLATFPPFCKPNKALLALSHILALKSNGDSQVPLGVPLRGKILVLGDGDFSFSKAIALQTLAQGGKAHITATSLDSRANLLAKYGKAADNLRALRFMPHVRVHHGVDATNLEETLCPQLKHQSPTYDAIVWNFPYPVQLRSPSCSPGEGSALLVGLFSNVGPFLVPEGEV